MLKTLKFYAVLILACLLLCGCANRKNANLKGNEAFFSSQDRANRAEVKNNKKWSELFDSDEWQPVNNSSDVNKLVI